MTKPLKLIAIGNSTGVILPKELLAKLRVGQGDSLFVSETPDGAVRLSASDPDFAEKMRVAEEIMREDRDILRILAQ
ncbi:AbrB/MazE/SpoVT family DNA-binding domain-containing protein [Sphingomonas naphthae]|uniref:AbrB/MazE/SpoVT family DNA-binding domain-containing protein n=1 Tax=Sphingomonas naphthae TaxID=1813468 RepID=A0ABY7TJD6_9SPHN|nr:AbrB/MazE/SpoVT family DNA-binding domain-containing protein [Sphingomonas naphthae]WCT72520.1 AbrB/MazE/SpoVT family DNA-binding domain-containing protein [Sphingomonas naphthae]